ncbi:putative alpha/Beta hydrolase [Plasmopara halstedii]
MLNVEIKIAVTSVPDLFVSALLTTVQLFVLVRLDSVEQVHLDPVHDVRSNILDFCRFFSTSSLFMGNGVSSEMQIFADGEMEAELKRLGGTGDASVKELLGNGYHDVVKAVIRPKRALYDLSELGPECFQIAGLSVDSTEDDETQARRKDFDVYNERGLRVCCSHWQLFLKDSITPAKTPCLIYLHSNIGSRLDALRVRDLALKRGFSVLAFDCCGSGLSDGVYVTMGWNEALDLFSVLQTLENDESVSDICLYAHSMGVFPAVTNVAIRAAGAADKKMQARLNTLPHVMRTGQRLHKPIRAIVLDSAYASVREVNEGLLREMQMEGFSVPKAVTKVAVAAINKSVKKRTEVDLELLSPGDFVELCYAPALFVAANSDRYVSKEQSNDLAVKYSGPTEILRVEGEHYDARDATAYSKAIDFLYAVINPRL